MGNNKYRDGISEAEGQQRLLSTLEQLLAIDATNLKSALEQATGLIAEALHAEKTDAFLYDPSKEIFVAVGTSNTPMGVHQRQIGLDIVPLANGGPEAFVFQTGESYTTGHADKDPRVPRGVTEALGVRSLIISPLIVSGERRGVMQASSA